MRSAQRARSEVCDTSEAQGVEGLSAKSRLEFLDFLRAIACLLVVYSHLIGSRAPNHWFIKPFIDRFVTSPFGIMWEFGYFGVALFYLISGFIICDVAQRELRLEFLIKRFFRIFPMLWLALVIALILHNLVAAPHITFIGFLKEASLFGSKFILIGPTYTLTIELFFYTLALIFLPWLKSRPFVATAIVSLCPILIFALATPLDQSAYPQLYILLYYTPFVSVFSVGMAVYYHWAKRLSLRSTIFLTALSWCAFVISTTNEKWTDGRIFPSNTFYALIVFICALKLMQIPRNGFFIRNIALASFSIYLLHEPIGVFVITSLQSHVGYTASLIASLVAIGTASGVTLHLIEKPSQALARRLVSHLESLK